MMRILGIETSCDETAAAIVERGADGAGRILSNVIRSQIAGASLTILDAAHISNVEQAHAFTDAVVGFLTQR